MMFRSRRNKSIAAAVELARDVARAEYSADLMEKTYKYVKSIIQKWRLTHDEVDLLFGDYLDCENSARWMEEQYLRAAKKKTEALRLYPYRKNEFPDVTRNAFKLMARVARKRGEYRVLLVLYRMARFEGRSAEEAVDRVWHQYVSQLNLE